jgi:hypothetical protein
MFKRSTYANVMSTLAVFLVVAGGSAFAASTITANSIKSKAVVDNSLKSKDLKDDKAVAGVDVIDASLTGADVADSSLAGIDIQDDSLRGDDVDESTLARVPDSAKLEGRTASTFLSSSVYKAESSLGPGTTLGDGTSVISQACDNGDILLSGGPANIRDTSTMLESFPSPGGTNSWTSRINKNGQADNFSTVVLCIDQT